MKIKDLRMKRAAKAVLMVLLLSAAGMTKGFAYNVPVGEISNDNENTSLTNGRGTAHSISTPYGGNIYISGGDYYYEVIFFNSAHGNTYFSDKYSATEGEMVTLTAYPNVNFGFELTGWNVYRGENHYYDNPDYAVAFSTTDNPNQIVFEMPDDNVYFYATFATDRTFHSITPVELSEASLENCSVGAGLGEYYPYYVFDGIVGFLAGETVTITIQNVADGYALSTLEVTAYDAENPYYWSEPIATIYHGSEVVELNPFENFDPIPFMNESFTFTMPDEDVGIRYEVVECPYVYYTMVKSVDDLVPGKHYVIVSEEGIYNVGGTEYYVNSCCMSVPGENNNRCGVLELIYDETARPLEIGFNQDYPFYEFVISGSTSDNWTIYDENEGSRGYLYAASSAENQLKTSEELTDNALWSIAIASDGKATITAQGDNTHNVIRFAPNVYSSDGTFSCYASSDEQLPVYIFKKMAQDADYDFYSNSTIESLVLGENEWYSMCAVGTYTYFDFDGREYQSCTVHAPAALTVTNTIENNTGDAIIGTYWVEDYGLQYEYRYSYENLVIEDGGQLIANHEDDYVYGMVQKNIAAHGETIADGGWYFIAPPLENNSYYYPEGVGIMPSEVGNMIDDSNPISFDLYRFNQSAESEWENYKAHNTDDDLFYLVKGQGYLYANAQDVTLNFVGNVSSSGSDVDVELDFNNGEGVQFAGWNLVGNPFPCNASVTTPSAGSCYVISDGAIIATTGTVLSPCSGVMVKATATGQSVTFSPTTDAASFSVGNNQLNITLTDVVMSRNDSNGARIQDNAIVSFSEGSQLEKFVFNADAAKLYIPQDGKEYAIATSEGQGEMSLNFKATKDGTYTIAITPENVEMNYLHLIDNMTGADVDLLALRQAQGPANYTFTAKTTDYESRFKLVFSASSVFGDEYGDNATFAFFSNGNFIVSNEGEATLQVIDMTGRILNSQSINGNSNVHVNVPAGVYVLRLLSDNNVKTQKIVIE